MNIFVSVSSYLLGKQLGIEKAHAEFQRQLKHPSADNLPCVRVIHRLQDARGGHDVTLFHNWATDLPKLRSRAADAFLQSGCELWLMVDDDVECTRDTLETLLEVATPDAIAVLPCLLRGTEEEKTRINVVYASPLTFERHGRIPVRRLLRGGTGLMVVSRAAIQAMAARFEPELGFIDEDEQPRVALFAQIIADRRWYGEDFSFCLRAAAADVQIYAPTEGVSRHDGRVLDLRLVDVQ